VKDIMTAPQVAAFLSLTPATVRRLTVSGKLPGRRVGKQYRYSKKAIEKWIRNERC